MNLRSLGCAFVFRVVHLLNFFFCRHAFVHTQVAKQKLLERCWIDSAIKRKLDAELGMREIIRKKGAEARDYNAELRNLQEQLQRAKKMKSPDTRDSIRTIGERIRKLNGLIKLVSANIKQLKRDQKSGDNLLGANLSLYVKTTKGSKVVKDSKKQRDEAKRMVA